jgi:hypothetical protein
MIVIFTRGKEYTLDSHFMMEGVNQSIYRHIEARQNKEYSKSTFHKYIRLYTLETNSNDNETFYMFTKLKRGLLNDFAQLCIDQKKYLIFETEPIIKMRQIIYVIFGLPIDEISQEVLSKIKVKINARIFTKAAKAYINDPERFQRKHYLEDFVTFTEAERELCWQITKKPREMLAMMINSNK